jgi:hypothetical protein
MMKFSPETHPIIEGHEPAASNAIAATCDPVYLGNADGVWILVHEDYAVDATPLVMTLNEGATSAEALAGTSAIAATWGGWKNITCQTSDAITALTAAATFTLDGETAGNNCLWMFYFPAISLTDGNDWVQPDFAAGNAGNIANVLYILDGFRYKQASPPTAVA